MVECTIEWQKLIFQETAKQVSSQGVMAERIVPLLVAQVALVRIPVPDRPTFRVEMVALFCNPASGGMFSSTAIQIIKWV
jgi:hypothetical protein